MSWRDMHVPTGRASPHGFGQEYRRFDDRSDSRGAGPRSNYINEDFPERFAARHSGNSKRMRQNLAAGTLNAHWEAPERRNRRGGLDVDDFGSRRQHSGFGMHQRDYQGVPGVLPKRGMRSLIHDGLVCEDCFEDECRPTRNPGPMGGRRRRSRRMDGRMGGRNSSQMESFSFDPTGGPMRDPMSYPMDSRMGDPLGGRMGDRMGGRTGGRRGRRSGGHPELDPMFRAVGGRGRHTFNEEDGYGGDFEGYYDGYEGY